MGSQQATGCHVCCSNEESNDTLGHGDAHFIDDVAYRERDGTYDADGHFVWHQGYDQQYSDGQSAWDANKINQDEHYYGQYNQEAWDQWAEDDNGYGNNGFSREFSNVAVKDQLDQIARDCNFSCTLGESCDFTIQIVKRSAAEPMGITLKTYHGSENVVIKEPRGDYISDWNVKHPEKRVRAADQITNVNGVSGDARAILEALRAHAQLTLHLRRQLVFTLSMLKTGMLGMKLGKDSCEVLGIVPSGMIDQWNQISEPHVEVVEGDQVVKVDQETTDLFERVKALKDGDYCTITFMRTKVPDSRMNYINATY